MYIFFVKTDLVAKQFQELAIGISKILLCLQTMECLLWFSMFIYIFFVKTDFVSKQFQELDTGISKILLYLQTTDCLLWFPMFIYIFFRQNRLCCLKVCKLINTRFTIRLVTSSIFISLFLAWKLTELAEASCSKWMNSTNLPTRVFDIKKWICSISGTKDAKGKRLGSDDVRRLSNIVPRCQETERET